MKLITSRQKTFHRNAHAFHRHDSLSRLNECHFFISRARLQHFNAQVVGLVGAPIYCRLAALGLWLIVFAFGVRDVYGKIAAAAFCMPCIQIESSFCKNWVYFANQDYWGVHRRFFYRDLTKKCRHRRTLPRTGQLCFKKCNSCLFCQTHGRRFAIADSPCGFIGQRLSSEMTGCKGDTWL